MARRSCNRRRLAAVLAALGLVAPLGLLTGQPAFAKDDGQALTPPMGWNSWNTFGGSVTEADVRAQADLIASSGLAAKGYDTVTVDDTWMAPSRDASGALVADPDRFPSGMKALADYVHSKGLRFALYESPTQGTCKGRPGSYGHEQRDANTFASWGVDYLKYDWCQTDPDQSPQMYADFAPVTDQNEIAKVLFTRMSDALTATGRPIVFSLSACCVAEVQQGFHTWGPPIAHLWRATGDISALWTSVVSNFKGTIPLQAAAGPGHWNDPDMLEIGNDAFLTDSTGTRSQVPAFTPDEARSHFSLWAIAAAPLIMGNDLRAATPETLSILGNKDVIAVDQDPLGVAGREAVAGAASNNLSTKVPDGVEVYTRPMANGDRVVAVLNTLASPATATFPLTTVGLPAGSASARDLWSGDTSTVTDQVTTLLMPHATTLLRITPASAITPGATELVNRADGSCLTSVAGSMAGSTLTGTSCAASPSQEISLSVGRLSLYGGTRCLASSTKPKAGDPVTMQKCTTQPVQQFTLDTTGRLVQPSTGLCLATAPQLELATCADTDAQRWWRQ